MDLGVPRSSRGSGTSKIKDISLFSPTSSDRYIKLCSHCAVTVKKFAGDAILTECLAIR